MSACTCGVRLSARNVSGLCRRCFSASRRIHPVGYVRACSDCSAPISLNGKSGRCRSCTSKACHRDPAWKARHQAALEASQAKPETSRRKSEALLRLYADPNERLKKSEARLRALQNPEVAAAHAARSGDTLRKWHATLDRDWSAYHRERQAAANAWCPAERLREYYSLSRRIGAVEAKRVLQDDIAAAERKRLAAMTGLERQMERLRAGARLEEKVPMPSRVYACTLGGVAPEPM